MSGGKNIQVLHTLAAAYAEAGDFTKAVKYQEQALSMVPAADKQEYQNRLDGYRARKPWREK